MSEPKEEKKSLLDKIVDAVTDRDEKAAAEKAAAEKAAAEKAAAEKAAAELAAQQAAAAQGAAEIAAAKAKAPKKGVVQVASLRIRKDHTTKSGLAGGLVRGDEVTILETWTDGKDTWAKLADEQWAAVVYDGETYITVE